MPQAPPSVSPSKSGADAGSSSGGSGFGTPEGAQTLITWANRSAPIDRPSEATLASVVNAQASDTQANPFGINLPDVKMPDPLPTSPFLKPA
jgi:cytoskeletal protein RodZ